MPRRFGRRYPRRKAKATSYMTTAGKGLYIASKALTVAKQVKSIINSEKKVIDNDAISTVSATAPVILPLTNIAQGDDFDAREGRSIKVISLSLKGYWTLTSGSSIVRTLVIRDNDNSAGTLPTLTQVMGAALPAVYAHRNALPQFRKRFTVLMDKLQPIGASRALTVPTSMFRKLNHHVTYSGTSASSYAQGHLYLVLITNASTGLSFSKSARLRYYDN